MVDLLNAESRLDVIERREERIRKDFEALNKYNKMPFFKRIQQKGFEDKLNQTYEIQKHSFKIICKREGIHKQDWKDEFCLFWSGFLKGEYKSINQYLGRKNYHQSIDNHKQDA
jgi:hypothetical protein